MGRAASTHRHNKFFDSGNSALWSLGIRTVKVPLQEAAWQSASPAARCRCCNRLLQVTEKAIGNLRDPRIDRMQSVADTRSLKDACR